MGLEARANHGRRGAAAHGLMNDLVSSNKHPVLVLAFEVLDSLDGAIVLAWGQQGSTQNQIHNTCGDTVSFLVQKPFPNNIYGHINLTNVF